MSVEAVDADFSPTDAVAVTLELQLRGVSRREIAARADGVRQRSGEAGTAREATSLLHAGLDDLQRRVYAEIDRDVETTAPLLEVLLGIHRLRAGMLAALKRQGGQ